MRIHILKNYEELSKKAAEIIKSQIVLKDDSVIGFATGSTPLGTYKELINMHKEGLDFSNITTFNLDEYYGLPAKDVNSYHYFMHKNLFDHINVNKKKVHIPDGEVKDVDKFCKDYEESIAKAGGIDLQILGIGKNGHIGFNEPDDNMDVPTHLTDLTEDTINANSRFFNSIDQVPKQAITMGLGTIMKSKRILLLASGEDKAEIIEKMLKAQVVTTNIPASFLFLHNNADIIVDEKAASLMGK
ncbi:MAG: glucosamine-6-phosphate deaminase [Bacillota bacterium]|nr:glucosamine-6-phosphate deaminase [Bacillota bacterium]